jgi:hypothetical protein
MRIRQYSLGHFVAAKGLPAGGHGPLVSSAGLPAGGHGPRGRRGAVLPVVAVCLIGLMGLVALAIDIGMVAVARTQAQNAADSSAMAGARTISGNSATNYNYDEVPRNAIKTANANSIFGTLVTGDPNTDWDPKDSAGNPDPVAKAKVHPADHVYQTGQVKVEVGAYAFTYNDSDPSKEGFAIQMPRADTTEPYSAVRTTISFEGGFAFGRIFGINTFNATAVATAVHRPRDVVIVLDLSGSMRFQSLLGIPYSGARTTSMNPDPAYPRFGHYSATSSAALFGNTSIPTGGGEMWDPANIAVTTNSGPPILEGFFKNNKGVAPVAPGDRAFARSSDAYADTPGGDDFLSKSGDTKSLGYAVTTSDVTGGTAKSASFETSGYEAYRSGFNGYTEGPGYWGKTFVVWPPDPRGPAAGKDPTNAADHADNGAKDWRTRFFFKYNTSTKVLGWLDHNSILWQTSSGTNPFIKTPQTGTSVTEVVNGVPTTVTYGYRINYAAILKWLQESPAHFPSQVRAGRIKFYDAIPDATDTTLNDRWWKTQTLSNLNERFWREYIDFVLGLSVNGTSGGYVTYTAGSSGTPRSSQIGNGDFYTWGTFKVSQKPHPGSATDVSTGGQIDNSAGYPVGTTAIKVKNISVDPAAGEWLRINTSGSDRFYEVAAYDTTNKIATLKAGLAVAVSDGNTVAVRRPPYMDYLDNPRRAKHQYWFGPLTWVDWLGNYNTSKFAWPGNIHEAQNWACKVGVQTAIDDIRNNHPSDFIGLCYFSTPVYSSGGAGQFNAPAVPLGRNYQQLKDALWFPPSTIVGGVTEITPYDGDFRNVPRAQGGTSPGMGFMLGYNLLSSSYSNLRSYPQPQSSYRGAIGGLGRRGASRLLIFETDGAPNTGSTAGLGGSGKDQYYKIRIYNPADLADSKNVEWPSNPSYSNTDVYNVVQQICKLDTDGGHGTKRKPVQVYSLGYGSLFDPANAGSTQTTALTFLQTVQYHGNTVTTTTGSDFPDDQRIYGPNEGPGGRIDRMQKAFTKIMQAGVQVSLIE